MIERCFFTGQKLEWKNRTGQAHVFNYPAKNFIFNETNIIVLVTEGNNEYVVALDCLGNEICRLENSDGLYVMYLQKHPQFGLCVVASIKNESGKWQDAYLSLNRGVFIKASQSR